MAQSAHSTGKASPGKLALLYDGSCEMCTSGVNGLCRFDNSGQMEPLDLNEEAARARFPDLKLENLLEELHAIDDTGRVYRGARAVNEILRRQNGIRSWFAYLWYVPGYAWLADRQYKRIAASRYQRDETGRLKDPAASSAAPQH
ncbi:MAG: thiol-disulfide oxidoreductase DCC family protein [Candidatus Binataceae bacterium]